MCLVSFPNILTLVIMMRMALGHFANDPLSALRRKLFIVFVILPNLFLTFTINNVLSPMVSLIRKIDIEEG